MRIEERRDDVLRDHDRAAPGDDALRAKEQREVGYPHGVHDDHAEEAELDRHGERLLMRILRYDGRGAAGADHRAELLFDRAGAVTDHGRGGDETQRLLPKFETLAGRGVRVLCRIQMDLALSLQDALAQIMR